MKFWFYLKFFSVLFVISVVNFGLFGSISICVIRVIRG